MFAGLLHESEPINVFTRVKTPVCFGPIGIDTPIPLLPRSDRVLRQSGHLSHGSNRKTYLTHLAKIPPV